MAGLPELDSVPPPQHILTGSPRQMDSGRVGHGGHHRLTKTLAVYCLSLLHNSLTCQHLSGMKQFITLLGFQCKCLSHMRVMTKTLHMRT